MLIPSALVLLLAAAPPEAALLGIWRGQASFGPEVRGELTLTSLPEGGWMAADPAGHTAPVQRKAQAINFSLGPGLGEFRGHWEGSGGARAVHGMWIQPKGKATGVAWATPLTFAPAGHGTYRATLVPLEEAMTLFLDVQREDDGSYAATLRNPDGFFHNGRGVPVLSGNHIKLLSLDRKHTLFEGEYDAQGARLTFFLEDPAVHFELRRGDSNYQPRESKAAYAYRPPTSEDDGWKVAALSDVGLDAKPLSALVQQLIDVDPSKQTSPLVQGLLIARHGKLVLEEYFFGFDREQRHDLRSEGKTFASVLLGAGMQHGVSLGPATKVFAVVPHGPELGKGDARKETMTLEHLMTMTSGFACDENEDENAPGNEDKMQNQSQQPDWYQFMLAVPMTHVPGASSAYCTGAVNLVGSALGKATGRWLPELFDEWYARPLQLQRYHINLMPTGEAYLGGGMHLRPRDELKLGQLYLNGGVWNGKRIVSAKWVAQSTTHPAGLAGTDGYDWHLFSIKAGERTYREYEASGNGGQLLMVVPELDLAVAFTAGNYQNYRVWKTFREELLPKVIGAAASP